jgi:hypothetical protein
MTAITPNFAPMDMVLEKIGKRRSHNVIITGYIAENEISHAAADEIRFIT